MTRRDQHEIDELGARLLAERPEPTAFELDRAHRRAFAGTTTTQPRIKGSLMRSRLALICILALGATLSGTGAALALSGDISASQAVYPGTTSPTTPVLGQQQSGGPTPTTPTTESLPSTVQPSVQATRQTSSSGNETLPFTGLAAIPIIVIGVVFLAGGFVLSRRTRAA